METDLDAVRDWGAAVVVTLIEDHEFETLGINGLGDAVRVRHMEWLHLPIVDVSTPGEAFEKAWVRAGAGLRARLQDGFNILFHCRGGLGRAGTIACRLLVELGMPSESALDAIRAIRPGAVETDEQERYVKSCRPMHEVSIAADLLAIENRAIGALLGLAVGDAVGTTLEFEPRDDKAPIQTDMVGGGPFDLEPGGWTDDTSMALALVDSLLATGDFDASDLLRRFTSWWKSGEYSHTGTCFDIGIQTREALNHFERTGDPCSGPIDPRKAGNGSLMRLSPVAIRYWNQPQLRASVAAGQSRTTHGSPETIDACVLFADILADAIAGCTRSEVLRPRAGNYTDKVAAIATGAWRGKLRAEIRGSGYVVHALEAALWCIGRTSSFRDAVLMAANLREDADTTAAITGQLAGALYGMSGIPPEWLARLRWASRIKEMAQRLFEKGSEESLKPNLKVDTDKSDVPHILDIEFGIGRRPR